LTKTGEDYAVKAAHVELAERMRKVPTDIICYGIYLSPFLVQIGDT
jgi:hypothetical protein